MVRRGTTEPPAPRLRGAVTLWILITCLISHVLLSHGENPLPGLSDPDPAEALRNQSAFLVHYVVPIMVVLDWLVFGPHGAVPWRTLPLWILFPLGYGAAVEARAAVWPGDGGDLWLPTASGGASGSGSAGHLVVYRNATVAGKPTLSKSAQSSDDWPFSSSGLPMVNVLGGMNTMFVGGPCSSAR